jgi:hypothetical protein
MLFPGQLPKVPHGFDRLQLSFFRARSGGEGYRKYTTLKQMTPERAKKFLLLPKKFWSVQRSLYQNGVRAAIAPPQPKPPPPSFLSQRSSL